MVFINRGIRSLIDSEGRLRIWLEDSAVQEPGADEVLVRVEAAPLNPSDQILLLGPIDPSTLRQVGPADQPVIEGFVPRERLASIAGRLGRGYAIERI